MLGRWGSHRFHVHTAPSCKCLSDCLVVGGRTGRIKEEKWCRESCFSCLRGRSRISTVSDTNFSHLNAEGERLGCRQPNSDAFYHQVWKHIWWLPHKEFIYQMFPWLRLLRCFLQTDVLCRWFLCRHMEGSSGYCAAIAAGWLMLNPVVRLPLEQSRRGLLLISRMCHALKA